MRFDPQNPPLGPDDFGIDEDDPRHPDHPDYVEPDPPEAEPHDPGPSDAFDPRVDFPERYTDGPI